MQVAENTIKKQIADKLTEFLAENYITFVKTQIFHWNVKGEMFYSLHKLFEEEYTDFFMAIDLIAETILQLGFPTPASFNNYLNLSSIKEEKTIPEAKEMIAILRDDYDKLTGKARIIIKMAEENTFPELADLMTQRIQVHNKNSWMLNSFLQ